jgi:hypothetical protein
MALLSVVSGPESDVVLTEVPCQSPVLWTIQVKNGNLGTSPNLANTAVTVKVGKGTYQVTTDVNGYITLVFGAGENLRGVTVAITHDAYLWNGNAGPAGLIAKDRYQSNAPLKGFWKVAVRVLQAVQPSALPMKKAPIHLVWTSTEDKTTGAEGGAYRIPQIPCQTDVTISVPASFGANAARSTAQVKINGNAADVTTADQAVSRDGATVHRTGANEVVAHVDKNGVSITVDLILDFTWNLSVLVKTLGAPGSTALPTLLNQAPIHIQTATATETDPETGADGSAYVKRDIPMGADYTVFVPDTYGANAVISAAEVKINGTSVDVSALDTAAKRDNGTVTRKAGNKVLAQPAPGVTDIEIVFLLRFAWKVKITVQDVTPKADGAPIRGAPINLKQIPVTLQRTGNTDNTPRTGDDGAAYSKNDMLLTTAYTISVPETYGAIVTVSTAAVKVNGTAVDVATANTPVTRDNVTVTRTALNKVTVTAASGCPEVEVDFKLQYPKIFIVGEGPLFPYAIGLAKRYAKGESAAARTLAARADAKAPDTVLSDFRKWIIASQFDVHPDPGGTLPRNLYVYRDSTNTDFSGNVGCFDVRKRACWGRLTNLLGTFDALIFNNPHPGYGMHRCDVFGLKTDREGPPGKYISVHTLGYGNTLSSGQVAQFRRGGGIVQDRGKWVQGRSGTLNVNQAANQRSFVQTVLAYVGDGTNSTSDYANDGTDTAQNITACFTALTDSATRFQGRVTHYKERLSTTGLWGSILECYRINGNAALKAGGALYLHGSNNFANADLTDPGGYLDGFASAGTWSDSGQAAANIYYANYATNFTSDTFHPSWFALVTFGPGEPGLRKAQCYVRTKT